MKLGVQNNVWKVLKAKKAGFFKDEEMNQKRDLSRKFIRFCRLT